MGFQFDLVEEPGKFFFVAQLADRDENTWRVINNAAAQTQTVAARESDSAEGESVTTNAHICFTKKI